MRNLWRAVTNTFRADTQLANLLNYSTSNLSIYYGWNEQNFRTNESLRLPILVIDGDTTRPHIEGGPNTHNKTTFTMYILAKDKQTLADILGRVKVMFDQDGVANGQDYLNFSDSNILCHYSRMIDMSGFLRDNNLGFYYSIVSFHIIWRNK